MKKVIMMVGTSLFVNYLEHECDNTFKNHFEALKNRDSKYYENELRKVKYIKQKVCHWLRSLGLANINSASAEIKSLLKLEEQIRDDDFEVHLLSSDTILGKLAGEILETELVKLKGFEIKMHVISDLQVKDSKRFIKGMRNLIDEIFEIADEYWGNVIMNITGGYKASIPYLTILAQLNGCPIYYIFEDQDALIKVPNLPFSTEVVDWKDLYGNSEIIDQLQKGICDKEDHDKLVYSEFYKKYGVLVWEEPPMAELNPLGKIIWETYKSKFFEFHINSQSKQKYSNSQRLKDVISKKFWKEEIREGKTEYKNGHRVYDDGDNPIRIFYLIEDNTIKIYNIFDNHEEYERYLNNNPYREEDVESQKYELEIIKKEV